MDMLMRNGLVNEAGQKRSAHPRPSASNRRPAAKLPVIVKLGPYSASCQIATSDGGCAFEYADGRHTPVMSWFPSSVESGGILTLTGTFRGFWASQYDILVGGKYCLPMDPANNDVRRALLGPLPFPV